MMQSKLLTLLLTTTVLLGGCYQKSDGPGIKIDEGRNFVFELREIGPCLKEGLLTQELQTTDLAQFAPTANLHDAYAAFLRESVVKCTESDPGDARINYTKLFRLRETGDSGYLALENRLLDLFKNEDLSNKSVDYKIAFYTNAYNFFAIYTILKHSQGTLIDSIQNFPGNAFADEPYHVELAGEKVSLDEIENQIIRPELLKYNDGRIHFALICASAGCPVILDEPFTEQDWDEQFTQVTQLGFQQRRIFHNEDEVTYLSMLFLWDYYQDFINELKVKDALEFDFEEEAFAAYIRKYTSPDQEVFDEEIDFIEYDWGLNYAK